MQASLSISQETQLDTWDGNRGINEQELGSADPEDSKATPHSDTRGDECGGSGVNSQLYRASFHIIHGDSLWIASMGGKKLHNLYT